MITNYGELKDTVRLWMSRNELDDRVETFIQLFETELKLDNRVRNTVIVDPFVIPAGGAAVLPEDFQEIVSWTLKAGGTKLPLAASSPDIVSRLNDAAGTPRAYFMVPGYAPGDYSTADRRNKRLTMAQVVPKNAQNQESILVYRQTITGLHGEDGADGNTNWLLNEFPAVYLYGTLAQTAPYLKDDARLPLWLAQKEEMVNRLFDFESRGEFAGPTNIEYELGGARL